VFVREDPDAGHIVYNRTLVRVRPPLRPPAQGLPGLPGQDHRHLAVRLRSSRWRASGGGKVERPFRTVREDFFPARSFQNLGDLNEQLRQWLDEVANPRTHATTRRVVSEHFAEERPSLQPLPAGPFQAVLRLERRITRDGMVSVDGNLYSVPDTIAQRSPGGSTRGARAGAPAPGRGAQHGPTRCASWRRAASSPSPLSPAAAASAASSPGTARRPPPGRSGDVRRTSRFDVVALRPLAFYDAVGKRLASDGTAA